MYRFDAIKCLLPGLFSKLFFYKTINITFGVQVSSEGSVPANDGKSNSRYVSCSKPSLHHHKAPLGAGAI